MRRFADPYFGLSVSRVDPLPHQLEAVYDHLLKLVGVRFLLADDAGAGKSCLQDRLHFRGPPTAGMILQ